MEDKIISWISKGGFPLEMRLSKALSGGGFDVVQSVYYRDEESNKYRETDIVASKYIKLKNRWIHVTFIIECKKITDKPWVVFKNKELSNISNNKLPVYHTENAFAFFENTENEGEFKSDLLYKNNRDLGYSVQTAFNPGVDKSYESIQSVTKACEYFSNKLNERRQVSSFYFPVIVVEGKLFEAFYSNEIEVNEVNESELLITRSFHKYGSAHIRIFNNNDLDYLTAKLDKFTSEFFEEYKDLLLQYVL